MEEIIKLENVSKKFGRKMALKNINLSLYSNKIYGFRGPNGSGKSVTFKTILGFIKPSSGKVFVEGQQIRKDVMFAPDTGFAIAEYGLLEDRTGIANLELLQLLAKDQETDPRKLMEKLGLDPDNEDKVKDYSLGMKQRLLIASALVGDKPILIFDEPTNALDEAGQNFLAKLMRELQQEGKTILLSSHDRYFLDQVADHVFVFSEGRIIGEEDHDEK